MSQDWSNLANTESWVEFTVIDYRSKDFSFGSIPVNRIDFDSFRHPMLRVYISKDEVQKKQYWSLCEKPTSTLSNEVISTVEVLFFYRKCPFQLICFDYELLRWSNPPDRNHTIDESLMQPCHITGHRFELWVHLASGARIGSERCCVPWKRSALAVSAQHRFNILRSRIDTYTGDLFVIVHMYSMQIWCIYIHNISIWCINNVSTLFIIFALLSLLG